jgi:hypothetical protein
MVEDMEDMEDMQETREDLVAVEVLIVQEVQVLPAKDTMDLSQEILGDLNIGEDLVEGLVAQQHLVDMVMLGMGFSHLSLVLLHIMAVAVAEVFGGAMTIKYLVVLEEEAQVTEEQE